MILIIILNWRKREATSAKQQAVDNLKKRFDCVGLSYIKDLQHLLQMQRWTGDN